MYGMDSGAASTGGASGGWASIIQKLLGGMQGGGAQQGGGGGGLGGKTGGGGWGGGSTAAGPKFTAGASRGAPPQPYQPQATMGEDPVMRPRQNAGGDFWGPVVRKLLTDYFNQQRGGGAGLAGAGAAPGAVGAPGMGGGL